MPNFTDVSAVVQALQPSLLGNAGLVNSLLTSVGVLVSFIPQFLQNGNAALGILPSPVLPPFLGGPGGPQDTGGRHYLGSSELPLSPFPWGNRTASSTDYYQDVPDTGVTRYYELNVTRQVFAPDGVDKEMLVFNSQFPGPTLEANWGDWVHVKVHNQIQDPVEGTTVHWHGLSQKGTQYYDGVPAISQCPIAPGASMEYRFRADRYGTSWYHSHYSTQLADGLYGPLIIYGPRNQDFDIDLGPIFVADHYHQPYEQVLQAVTGTPFLPAEFTLSESTLIEGKMQYNCSSLAPGTPCAQAGLAKFEFTPGKVHKLRFINPSALGVMLISIDGHTMQIVAHDFVPVEPYTTTTLLLAAGQRADVLVTANPQPASPNDAYWLRVQQPLACALSAKPLALAAIYYQGTNTSLVPASNPHLEYVTPRLVDCRTDPLWLVEPTFAVPVSEPDTTALLSITQRINATGHLLYQLDNSSFQGDYNAPILRALDQGNTTFTPNLNIHNFASNHTIRIILQNKTPVPHPFHIHGQDMLVLDTGTGSWDAETIVRPRNPVRRDTQLVQTDGYLVLQLTASNPGVWPLHCHFAWHASAGLFANIVQRPAEIGGGSQLEAVMRQSCDAWDRYTAANVVDQVDSGV